MELDILNLGLGLGVGALMMSNYKIAATSVIGRAALFKTDSIATSFGITLDVLI